MEDHTPHGLYHQQTEEEADIKKSFQWLEKADLKASTEALIMAAQNRPSAPDPQGQGSTTDRTSETT